MEISCYYPVLTKQDMKLPFYITTIGSTPNETLVHRPLGIQHYQLLYTKKGMGIATIRGKEYEIMPNSILFLPPFTPHEYRAKKEKWTTYWITFSGFATETFFDFDAEIWQLPENFIFKTQFKKILDLKGDENWCKKSSVLLYELLLSCEEYITVDNIQNFRLRNKLQPVFRYLAENYAETIELYELAEIIGVTEGYFCKIFKSFTNMRPFEYITRLRLQKAKNLLINPKNLTISEIGDAVGYTSSSYFSMIFKEYEGVTPSKFQELYASIHSNKY